MIKKVGERIRAIRESKNLTQANMAEELEMGESGYSKIERGDINTPLKRLFQIAEVLEVEIVAFFESKLPQVEDSRIKNAYSTRVELQQFTNTILKEIERLREELKVNPKISPLKKSAKNKK